MSPHAGHASRETLRCCIVFLALLTGCASPALDRGAGPTARAADAAAPVPVLAYQPLVTTDFAPVGPLDWTERNQAVAPPP